VAGRQQKSADVSELLACQAPQLALGEKVPSDYMECGARFRIGWQSGESPVLAAKLLRLTLNSGQFIARRYFSQGTL
jgi:hypothetical protein